jgi:hypothetical protein
VTKLSLKVKLYFRKKNSECDEENTRHPVPGRPDESSLQYCRCIGSQGLIGGPGGEDFLPSRVPKPGHRVRPSGYTHAGLRATS